MSNKTKNLPIKERDLNRANWEIAKKLTPTVTVIEASDYAGFIEASKIIAIHPDWSTAKVKAEVELNLRSRPQPKQKAMPNFVNRMGIVRAGRFLRHNKKWLAGVLAKINRLDEDSTIRKMLSANLPLLFKRQLTVEQIIAERHARTPLRDCTPFKKRAAVYGTAF